VTERGYLSFAKTSAETKDETVVDRDTGRRPGGQEPVCACSAHILRMGGKSIRTRRLDRNDGAARRVAPSVERTIAITQRTGYGFQRTNGNSGILRNEYPCFLRKRRSLQEFSSRNAALCFQRLTGRAMCTVAQIESYLHGFVHGQSEELGRRSRSGLE
jgi:hypothetical protein